MKFLGIVLIVVGILFLYQTIKFPVKEDYGAINFKGYIAGIGFVVLGIYLLLTS